MSQQQKVATKSKQEELFEKIMLGEVEILLCIGDTQFNLLVLLLLC